MNNGPHWRAAELHDLAAHAHRAAATHDDQTGNEHSKQAMEHAAKAYRYSQEAHQESESSVNETEKNVSTAPGVTKQTNARPKALARHPGKLASKTNTLKKVLNRKAAPKKKVTKERASLEKAESAKQARIEMEFMGPTEELGKLLFDLFQTHELKTGHAKEIAHDAKIELLPMRGAKDAPSVAVLLTIGLGVPESLASKYLWHKCRTFSKSREVKILVNGTEYVYNEHELKKIIKTTMEKETEEK
jgi:hypothetical protein